MDDDIVCQVELAVNCRQCATCKQLVCELRNDF